MKKRRKTLVSCLLALTMLLGMTANCLAANTVTITKVEILDGSDGHLKETYIPSELAEGEKINVQLTAEIIRITAKLETAATGEDVATAVANAAATILVNDVACDAETDATALSNETIQYIDQMNTNADGTVSFTYRNRTTVGTSGIGDFKVKVGGSDVSTIASTAYSVVTDIPTMELEAAEGAEQSFQKGKATEPVSFNLTASDDAAIVITKVILGDKVLDSTDYDFANNIITINPSGLNKLDVVGAHALTVRAEGKNEAYTATAVNVIIPDLSESDQATAESNLTNTVPTVSDDGKSATIPEIVGATNGVEVEALGTSADSVTVSGTTVALKDNVPFAKVDIMISVIGSDIAQQKTVYLVPDDAPVAFGNIGLHTVAGADAFVYDTGADAETNDANFDLMLTNYGEANIATDISVARSIAINGANADKYPHFGRALDFDHDGVYKLPEYRIFKLMMTKGTGHGFTAVNTARPAAPEA